MKKRVIVNPEENKTQDLEGLEKYLEPYADKVTIEKKEKGRLEITCPANFANAIPSLVKKYGYWASEIQNVREGAAT